VDEATQARVVHEVAGLADLVPEDVELGYHLCYGLLDLLGVITRSARPCRQARRMLWIANLRGWGQPNRAFGRCHHWRAGRERAP
jgi:hypothetical protein